MCPDRTHSSGSNDCEPFTTKNQNLKKIQGGKQIEKIK